MSVRELPRRDRRRDCLDKTATVPVALLHYFPVPRWHINKALALDSSHSDLLCSTRTFTMAPMSPLRFSSRALDVRPYMMRGQEQLDTHDPALLEDVLRTARHFFVKLLPQLSAWGGWSRFVEERLGGRPAELGAGRNGGDDERLAQQLTVQLGLDGRYLDSRDLYLFISLGPEQHASKVLGIQAMTGCVPTFKVRATRSRGRQPFGPGGGEGAVKGTCSAGSPCTGTTRRRAWHRPSLHALHTPACN